MSCTYDLELVRDFTDRIKTNNQVRKRGAWCALLFFMLLLQYIWERATVKDFKRQGKVARKIPTWSYPNFFYVYACYMDFRSFLKGANFITIDTLIRDLKNHELLKYLMVLEIWHLKKRHLAYYRVLTRFLQFLITCWWQKRFDTYQCTNCRDLWITQ